MAWSTCASVYCVTSLQTVAATSRELFATATAYSLVMVHASHVDLMLMPLVLFLCAACFVQRFNDLQEEVKCLAFSSDSAWLAVGFANGHIKILEYPAMKVQLTWR